MVRTDKPVCPVTTLLKFMVIRKAGPGPFFVNAERIGLTRRAFVDEVKKALRD